jgi:thioesterase superfamily protein 4
MEGAELNLLMSSPWAAVLINDPKWTRATTGSRLPKASGEDSFFAETLATDRTMRACLTLRPTEEADDDLPYKEIVTIVDLGDGVNGYPQTCHGGMVATLMDEVCGVLINLNTERHRDRLIQSGCQDPPAIMSYMTACESAQMRSRNVGLMRCRPQHYVQETRPHTWCSPVYCEGRATGKPKAVRPRYNRRWGGWNGLHNW